MVETTIIRMTSTPSGLRAHRKAQRYSQAQLADLVGVSQTTISLYEKGCRVPLETARRLADVLDCTIDDLFPNEAA